jgi:hypothetical protein
MRFRVMAGKVGIFLLAMLMLTSASGVHTAICHAPHLVQVQNLNEGFSCAGLEACNPETGHCNACYFNQILNQCVFPILGTILVSESFLFNEALFPKAAFSRALEHSSNRGPPAEIILF